MKRIHIVDDDPIVNRVVRLALQKEGYEVEVSTNGKEALKKVTHCTPDALITDIEMPQMTGEELCKEIHRLMPSRDFPIFVVTSLTAVEHRRWSNSIPDLNFLEKPISVRKLISRLAASFQLLNAANTEA